MKSLLALSYLAAFAHYPATIQLITAKPQPVYVYATPLDVVGTVHSTPVDIAGRL